MVDTDPRMELADLLADLRAYVAWQGLCGAEILPAEAVTTAPPPAERPRERSDFQPPPRQRPAQQQRSRPAPPQRAKAPQKAPPPRPAPPKPAPPKPVPARRKPSDPLPSAWASIVNAPKAAPTGAAALQAITESLSPNQPCPVCRNRLRIGRGEPTASVALISGETLVPQGREMLAGMLTRVLRINPREVFFIPVNRCASHHRPKQEGETVCASLLADQLAAVKPQLLLAFGRDASRVLFSPQRVQIRRGHWASYPTRGGPLPALMTFHPNFLLQHPQNKGHAFSDLKAFRARMDELKL